MLKNLTVIHVQNTAIEALISTEIFLKVTLRVTFKNISGF